MSTEPSGVFVLEDGTLAKQDAYIIENPPYQLSLTVEELIAPGKKTIQKSRVKSQSSSMMSYRPRNPPRQQNPFILFRKNYHARRRRENSTTKTLDAKDISSEISKDWERQTPIIKYFFEALARRACQRHEADYPGYKYSPKRNENRGEKRRRRKVENSSGEEAKKVRGEVLVENRSSPNSPNSQISETSESDGETITEQPGRKYACRDERKDELKKNEEESLTVVGPEDIVQSQSVSMSSSSSNNYLLDADDKLVDQHFSDVNAPRSYSPQIKITPQPCSGFVQTFTELLTDASADDSSGQVSAPTNYYPPADSQLGNFENFELEFVEHEFEQHSIWS